LLVALLPLKVLLLLLLLLPESSLLLLLLPLHLLWLLPLGCWNLLLGPCTVVQAVPISHSSSPSPLSM
jgi:hypothetical protein